MRVNLLTVNMSPVYLQQFREDLEEYLRVSAPQFGAKDLLDMQGSAGPTEIIWASEHTPSSSSLPRLLNELRLVALAYHAGWVSGQKHRKAEL